MIRSRAFTQHALFALIFLAAFVTGFWGIDFCGHWDEPVMMRSVHRVVETGRLLPDRYNYPSGIHHMVWLCLVPDVVGYWGGPKDQPAPEFRRELAASVMELPFAIRARTVFLLVTLLALLWTYLFVLKWRGNGWEALLAVALLGTSWEVAYHARWVTPDGVLMQYGALHMLVLLMALKSVRHKRRWLWLSALVAALACGTKYTGGILLVPTLLYAAYLSREQQGRTSRVLAYVGGSLVVFVVAFLATTPGILIEPNKFIQGVLFEMNHYKDGHFGHTVSPGVPHAALMVVYLSLSAFSKFWPIAVAYFAFVVVGAYVVTRHDRRAAFVLLLIPVLYFVFVSTQRVMFVRNLQILFPFMAVLGARGMMWVAESLRGRSLRSVYLAVIGAGLIVNLLWLIYAANTITSSRSMNDRARVLEYLSENEDEVIFMSGMVKHLIGDDGLKAFSGKITRHRTEATTFVIDTRDVYRQNTRPANRFGQWRILSGSFEVNFDYYPTWACNSRVVAVDGDVGRSLQLLR